MMFFNFRFVLCLVLFACPLFIVSVDAQSCGSRQLEENCYVVRTSCKWSSGSSTCVNGAPSTCSEFYRDTTGCSSNANCHYDPTTLVCADGAPCRTFTNIQCLDKSYCYNNYTVATPVCTAGTPSDGCSIQTSASPCTSHASKCFWDAYLGKCFLKLQQVNQLFNCSYWNTFTNADIPCTYHGCSYVNSRCVSTDSLNRTQDSQISLDYSSLIEWKNAQILPNSLTLQVEAWQPLNLRLSTPEHVILGFGSSISGLKNFYTNPSVCTSLSTHKMSVSPAVTYAPGAAALTTEFVNFVRARNNFNFNSSTTEGSALYQLFGNVSIGTNATLVKTVEIAVTNDYIIYTLRFSLPWAYTYCKEFGVSYSQTVDQSAQYYSIPLNFIIHTSSDSWIATSRVYQIGIASNGGVVLSSSSYVQTGVAIDELSSISDSNCPDTTQQRARQVYRIVYRNVYDPSVQIGPISVNDFQPTSDNCYGDTAQSLSTLYYQNNAWYYSVTMLSRCMNIPLDGSAFLTCSNVPDVYKLQDLGSLSLNYSSTQDRVHKFTIRSWICPVNRVNDLGCSLLHPPPHDVPDTVTSIFSLNAWPTQLLEAPNWRINYGILRSSNEILDETLENDIFGGAAYTGSFADNTDQRTNISLALRPLFGKLQHINFAIQLEELTLRGVYQLSFNINNMTIHPTNLAGEILPDLPKMNYRDIQHALTIAPRMDCSSEACPTLLTCINQADNFKKYKGCDSMSIVGLHLINLYNQTVQGFLFDLYYTLYTGDANGNVVGRRLLQVTTTSSSEFGAVKTMFVPAQLISNISIAESSSSSSTGTANNSTSDSDSNTSKINYALVGGIIGGRSRWSDSFIFIVSV